jgi:hypothetical protein
MSDNSTVENLDESKQSENGDHNVHNPDAKTQSSSFKADNLTTPFIRQYNASDNSLPFSTNSAKKLSSVEQAPKPITQKIQGKRSANGTDETLSTKRQKTCSFSDRRNKEDEDDRDDEPFSPSLERLGDTAAEDDLEIRVAEEKSEANSKMNMTQELLDSENIWTDEYDAIIDKFGQIQILENHPFDKKKAACCFCYETGDRKKQGELLCLGRLTFTKGCSKKLYWAHENCLYMSSRKVKTSAGDQMQLESDMELLRRLYFPIKCKHVSCGKPRATVGCTINSCKNIYHYHCAYKSGGEYLITSTYTRFYCPRHLSVGILEKMKCVRWPADCGIRYITRNSWHKIEDSYKNAIYQNKFHWEKFDTEWFRQDLSPRIYIRRIYPGHWAWSEELEQRGKTDPKYAKQYEAVAASDIEPSEVIGEYVGIVKRLKDGNNSKYLADFWFPETLPSSLLIDPICIDAEEWANETRFINSVTPSTPPYIEQNATMSTLWCRGELRILILSTKRIPAHTSIVLNYNEFSSSYFEETPSPRKSEKCYVWVPLKDQGEISQEMIEEIEQTSKKLMNQQKGENANKSSPAPVENQTMQRLLAPKRNIVPRSPDKFSKQQRVSKSVRHTSEALDSEHKRQIDETGSKHHQDEKTQSNEEKHKQTNSNNSLYDMFKETSELSRFQCPEHSSSEQRHGPLESLLQRPSKQKSSNSSTSKHTKGDHNNKNRNKLNNFSVKMMNNININVKNQKNRKTEGTSGNTTAPTTGLPSSDVSFAPISPFRSRNANTVNNTGTKTTDGLNSNIDLNVATHEDTRNRSHTDQYAIAAAQKEIDFFAE